MKKKTSTIIIAVLACIIAICLVIIVRHVWIQKNNNKVYDNLQSEVHNTTEQIRDTRVSVNYFEGREVYHE